MVKHKEKQDEIQISQDKSLEELLNDSNYSFSSKEFDNVVENIKTIKNFEHNDSAKEFIRQILLKGDKLEDFLYDNNNSLKENYNNDLISKIENLAKREKEQYQNLMKPFIEDGNIENNFTFAERFTLGWYKFCNKIEKHQETYEKIFGRETLNSLKKTKEGLKEELKRAIKLKEAYASELKVDKDKISYMVKKLEKSQNYIGLANDSLATLEERRNELEQKIEESDDFVELAIQNELEQRSEDIEKIQEEAVDALDSADNNKLSLVDLKINVHEKTQLKTFYNDMAKTYNRHIDILANLILKIDKGMSYDKAHQLIKRFVQYDAPISKYMDVRKKELEKYKGEFLRINPPYVKDKFVGANTRHSNLDYKLRIEEGSNELKEFLKDFKKH